MRLAVQIRTILAILLTLLITNYITAQHQIDKDVVFSHKGQKDYVRLNVFLGHYKIDEKKLEKCMTAFGVIKFQITPKGKIASIDTNGNLPTILIDAIKERILLTENCWIFSDDIIKANKNIEFHYPVYMSINLEDKCNISIHESYELLSMLFENQKVIHIKDRIYFIAPEFWSAIR